MGTATIVSAVLERLLQSEGFAEASFDTSFFTESVEWKRSLCQGIYSHIQEKGIQRKCIVALLIWPTNLLQPHARFASLQ